MLSNPFAFRTFAMRARLECRLFHAPISVENCVNPVRSSNERESNFGEIEGAPRGEEDKRHRKIDGDVGDCRRLAFQF